MLKTIKNNNVILIDPDEEPEVIAALLIRSNTFVSIRTAELFTTLDKTTQYRERVAGRFPKLYCLTPKGRRKAYKLQELLEWLNKPTEYSCSDKE